MGACYLILLGVQTCLQKRVDLSVRGQSRLSHSRAEGGSNSRAPAASHGAPENESGVGSRREIEKNPRSQKQREMLNPEQLVHGAFLGGRFHDDAHTISRDHGDRRFGGDKLAFRHDIDNVFTEAGLAAGSKGG